MKKISINSKNAPEAIGPYSQAIRKGNIVFLSGQIPLDPKTMELVDGIEGQIKQVFENLSQVIKAADASFDDVAKLNIYLTDLSHFVLVNEIMQTYFTEPFPARAAIGVASLPKGSLVEADGFLVLE
ncbi:RidA family protein [Methylophilaceae bacterium]|jgi:reactive intermediate/imine deaminase|nr:RidA family protein [Methylophilaceae bacterium]|tara:strand:- start:1939 stop:2319 length:381 start_codon:yes stop_codon:yes gene_type:complete